jgi:tyrosine-specific transport protein
MLQFASLSAKSEGKMKQRQVFGAILLLAGTCIGAGMLALPVSTAPMGFFYALLLLFLAWWFMAYTGYLVVEANLWLPSGTHYISMAKKTLGRAGQWISWVVFLLLLYALMSAYITGGGAIVRNVMSLHGVTLAPWQSDVPWIVVFAIIIYLGPLLTDLLNRLLMLGLIVSYAAMGASATPHLHMSNLLTGTLHWHSILIALPILLASFGYHIVLPSMRTYLKSDVPKLRRMVLFGSLLPLVMYVLWILLVFGVVSQQGDNGLLAILKSGEPTDLLTRTLSHLSGDPWLGRVARFFAFFAIASSFVGVSLGLFDLLSDGLKVKRNHLGRSFIALLTFVPPLLFACFYPDGFLFALGYAGVFVAVLHGILPAAMVWSGRYHLKLSSAYRVIGGRLALIIVFLISLLVIYAQVVTH